MKQTLLFIQAVFDRIAAGAQTWHEWKRCCLTFDEHMEHLAHLERMGEEYKKIDRDKVWRGVAALVKSLEKP